MGGVESRKVFIEPSLVMEEGSFYTFSNALEYVEAAELHFPREFYELIQDFDNYEDVAPLRFFKDRVRTRNLPDWGSLESRLGEMEEEGLIEFYEESERIDRVLEGNAEGWETEVADSLREALSFYEDQDGYEKLLRILLTEVLFLFEESWFISRFEKTVEKFGEAGFNSLRLTKQFLRENFRKELDWFQDFYNDLESLGEPESFFIGFGTELGKIGLEEVTDAPEPITTTGIWMGKGGARLIVYADP